MSNEQPVRAYLVALDATKRVNVHGLHAYLKDSADIVGFWNYIPFVYAIKTPLSSTDLSIKIHAFVDRASFIVAEVNPRNVKRAAPHSCLGVVHC